MVTRSLCWRMLALISLLACAWTWSVLVETQRQVGRLRWNLGLVMIEETALQHRLDEERVQRARGLVAAIHRPVTPELVTIVRRIPDDVRVSDITVTAQEWQITGQRSSGTEADLRPVVTLRFARSDVERRE